PELLADLARGGDGRAIAGASFRDGDEVVHNPEPPDIDLRDLPDVFTDDNLPMAGIFHRNRNAVLAYETGRGCRQKCKFCLYAVSKLRVFAMERVERELRWLLERRVPYIRICDAHFGVSKPRAMETFEIIAAHNDGTMIDVYPDTKHVDLDYVRAMNKAGCRVVSLGIQSSDLDTLGIAQRRFDPQRFGEVARLIRRHHNHALAADVIVGMPGDDYPKVRESVRFAYRSGVQTVHFAPLMAFPGTDFFENAESYGLEFFDFAPPLAIRSTTFSAEDYLKSMLLAHRVESLQKTAPMLLRCLLADPDGDVVGFAETLDFDAAANQTPDPLDAPLLDRHVTDQASAEVELLRDGLHWDRAARDQQRAEVPAVSVARDGMRLEVRDRDAVHWFTAPIHRLTRDAELTVADLPRGKFAYVFPCGGAAVYAVEGILAAGLEAALEADAGLEVARGSTREATCETREPGQTVAEWRRRTMRTYAAQAAEGAVPATPALCDSVLRVLRLSGV
ncbi:MAG: B12-binding domain-containing radical SAM protein, partial [Actinocrinis sp.]